MRLADIGVPAGATKSKKRVGRGVGSGHGKTSTRGQKGQRSRSGPGIKIGFEGGQMPLIRTIPKRGFTNRFKKTFQIVNLSQLADFKEKEMVNPDVLLKAGIIKKIAVPVKILGDGELMKPLIIKAHCFSSSAKEKIVKAGGSTEAIK